MRTLANALEHPGSSLIKGDEELIVLGDCVVEKICVD